MVLKEKVTIIVVILRACFAYADESNIPALWPFVNDLVMVIPKFVRIVRS